MSRHSLVLTISFTEWYVTGVNDKAEKVTLVLEPHNKQSLLILLGANF